MSAASNDSKPGSVSAAKNLDAADGAGASPTSSASGEAPSAPAVPQPTAASAVAPTPTSTSAASSPVPAISTAPRQPVRFAHVTGPGQLHAAVLALLLTPGRTREMAVWRTECRHTVGARDLRNELMAMDPAEQMPWLEYFLGCVARGPLDKRQQLMRAARRLIGADGRALPLDRLRWLALRHVLGDEQTAAERAGASVDFDHLAPETVHQVGSFTAFLSRIVPLPEVDIDVVSALPSEGEQWWRDVMKPWWGSGLSRQMPDSNALVAALHELQALPWLLRPVLVRRWVDAAVNLSPAEELRTEAAQALRIAARLLDCPLPPKVSVCFFEVAFKRT